MHSLKYSGGCISNIDVLAKTLSIPASTLLKISRDPSRFYYTFSIPKKSGGSRPISSPKPILKTIQRRIVCRIFSNLKFPSYLTGSIRDKTNPRDFVRNANIHKSSSEVILFDINSFFPSIRKALVVKSFRYLFGFTSEVAQILAELTTLENSLPQGAPTSSCIANLIFFQKEPQLVKELESLQFNYSRLIDDITISSTIEFTNAQKIKINKRVRSFLTEYGMHINEEKYRISSTKNKNPPVKITGIIIDGSKLALPKEQVKAAKSGVYELEQSYSTQRDESEYHKRHNKISGIVALYSRITPDAAALLRNRLSIILPRFSKEKAKKIQKRCEILFASAKKNQNIRNTEEFHASYHRLRYKIGIIARNNKELAKNLYQLLNQIQPKFAKKHFYE